MNIASIILKFLLRVTIATAIQILGIFGIFLVFGLVLSFINRCTTRSFYRTVGWKGVLWTAWLGTPIHETGHAILALLFGHKITEMRLFSPNEETGELGYVNHSYNPASWYQDFGIFFIGIGPLLFGSLAIGASLNLLPNGEYIFRSMISNSINIFGNNSIGVQLRMIGASSPSLIRLILSSQNLLSLRSLIFFYIALCIASHMGLSSKDLEGVEEGFGFYIIILFSINFILFLFGVNITKYVLSLCRYLGYLLGFFMLGTILSFMNFLVSYLILGIYHRYVQKRGMLNPF